MFSLGCWLLLWGMDWRLTPGGLKHAQLGLSHWATSPFWTVWLKHRSIGQSTWDFRKLPDITCWMKSWLPGVLLRQQKAIAPIQKRICDSLYYIAKSTCPCAGSLLTPCLVWIWIYPTDPCAMLLWGQVWPNRNSWVFGGMPQGSLWLPPSSLLPLAMVWGVCSSRLSTYASSNLKGLPEVDLLHYGVAPLKPWAGTTLWVDFLLHFVMVTERWLMHPSHQCLWQWQRNSLVNFTLSFLRWMTLPVEVHTYFFQMEFLWIS